MADPSANAKKVTDIKTVCVNAEFPSDYSEEKLSAVFADCGTVLKATLLKRRGTGEFKGFGFVEFDSHEAALKAVNEKNNEKLGDSRLGVVLSTSTGTKPKKNHDPVAEGTTLFVRQLAYKIRRKHLSQAFREFGEIQSCRVSQKGYGFVEFSTVEEAKKAMAAMDGKELGGRTIAILFAKPRPSQEKTEKRQPENAGEDQADEEEKDKRSPEGNSSSNGNSGRRERKPRRKLFLKNISNDVSEEELRGFLNGFGEIAKCKLIQKEKRSFAYVTMADSDDAKKAIDTKTGNLQGEEFTIFWAPSYRNRRNKRGGNRKPNKNSSNDSADA